VPTGQSPSADRDHLTLRFDYQIKRQKQGEFRDEPGARLGRLLTERTALYPAGISVTCSARRALQRFVGLPPSTPACSTNSALATSAIPAGHFRVHLGCCWNGAGSTICRSRPKRAGRASPQSTASFIHCAEHDSVRRQRAVRSAERVSPRLTYSPMLQFADTLSWNHGSHSFQGGFDITREYSQSSNSGGTQTTASVSLGVGLYRCRISTATNFGGLNASDVTTAKTCWPPGRHRGQHFAAVLDQHPHGYELVGLHEECLLLSRASKC